MDPVQKTEEEKEKAVAMQPAVQNKNRKKKKKTTKKTKMVKTPFNAAQKEVLDNFQKKLLHYISTVKWCYQISKDPSYEDIREHLSNTHYLFVLSIKDNDASNYDTLLGIAAANEETTLRRVDREAENVLSNFFADLVIPSAN